LCGTGVGTKENPAKSQSVVQFSVRFIHGAHRESKDFNSEIMFFK
jgi:hypothetical protein